MTNDKQFQLQPVANKPRPALIALPDAPKFRQTVLFSGLDCCPGQLDLFQTDGPKERAPQERSDA